MQDILVFSFSLSFNESWRMSHGYIGFFIAKLNFYRLNPTY